MPDAAKYSIVEPLRDGAHVEIRALTPGDQSGFLAAVDQVSAPSLYRRLFSPRRSFTAQEMSFFLNADFVDHVALVAVMEEAGIVGGGRYIVERPGEAELAFVVIDRYQGRGIGSALMRHLAAIARSAGLKKLTAQVLSDNVAMLSIFRKSGFEVEERASGLVYLALRLR